MAILDLKEILNELKHKKMFKCELKNNDDYIYFYVNYDNEVDKLKLMINFDKFNKLNLSTTKTENLNEKEIEDYIKGTSQFINLLKNYIIKIDYSFKSLGLNESDEYTKEQIEQRQETEDRNDINEIIKNYCLNDVASMYNFIASFSKSVINNYQNELKDKIKKKQKNT